MRKEKREGGEKVMIEKRGGKENEVRKVKREGVEKVM